MRRSRRSLAGLLSLTLVAAVLALTVATSASAPAGQLDASFGVGGVVRYNVGGAFVSGDQGNAILALPDGKVLLAGQGGLPNGNVVLLRVLADGTPDPSFGNGGLVNNSFSASFSGATALARQPDGKILAGGYANVGISHNLAIVRYLENGALDTSFSGDGLVTGININGWPPGIVNGLVVQADGRIVAVTDTSAGTSTDVVRFNSDGSLDTTFGTGGRVSLAGRATSSIAQQSDGRIVVAAATSGAPYKMAVTRLTVDGAIDTTFGGAGTGTATIGGHASDNAGAVVVAGNDAIVVAGKGSSGTGSDLAVARLTADGSLDAGFGTAGYANLALSDSYLAVHGLALQADGKVLAVGGVYSANAYRWFVARFLGTGSPDATFNGNGVVTFETGDALAVAFGGDGAFVTGAQGASGDLMIYKFGTGTPPATTTTIATPTTAPVPTSSTTTIGGTAPAIGARFVAVEPTRILDTRATGQKVRAGTSIDVDVATAAGVPRDATAVVNLTATDADGPGYVTVWPTGSARPEASSLNVATTSGTIANLVTMPLSASGSLSLFSQSGAHLIVDLLGYYEPVHAPIAGGRFQPVPTTRILDTRLSGTGAPSVVDVPVDAIAGIPTGRASALVINLTATESTSAGFVTVWPRARGVAPETSNLNLDAPGQTRANQVIVAVGDGTIRLATASGAHLVVDVVGFLTADTAPVSTSGLFVPFAPRRVLDTRRGLGAPAGIIGPSQQRDVEVRSRVPVPGIAAVVGNVTATESLAPGFVTIWPRTDGPRPEVSTLNLDEADQTRANHASVPIAADGTFSVFTQSGAHVLVDLAGAYLA